MDNKQRVTYLNNSRILLNDDEKVYIQYTFDEYFGTNWIERTWIGDNKRWVDMDMSSTGQYCVLAGSDAPSASFIVYSDDYGTTGTNILPSGVGSLLSSINISSNGGHIIGSTSYTTGNIGSIFFSKDSGSTWTTVISGTTSAYQFNDTAMNSTGQYMMYCVGSTHYISNDYGSTWFSGITASGTDRLAISSTGQYMIISHGFDIYVSDDYGASFVLQYDGSAGLIRRVSISSTGQYQAAARESANLLLSNDYGDNWSEVSFSGLTGLYHIDMDDTGQYMICCDYNDPGNIYTSIDYGQTWTERASARDWASVSVAGDASHCIAGEYSGNYWTNDNT